MASHSMPRISEFACLEVKMIGKPYAGELQVRFDEGKQDFVPRRILNVHAAGNDGHSQGLIYRIMSLFSTLPAAPRASSATPPPRTRPSPPR
jgi:hypothetical protein